MKLLSKLRRLPAGVLTVDATAAIVAACSSVLSGNSDDATTAAAPMDVAKKIRLSLQWLGAQAGAVEDGSSTAAEIKRLAGNAEAADGDAEDDEVSTARKAAQLSAVLQLKVAKCIDDVEAVLGLIVEKGEDGMERFQAGVGSVDVISALAVAIQTFVAPPPQQGKPGTTPTDTAAKDEKEAEAEAEGTAAVAAIAADAAVLDDEDDVIAAAARIVARTTTVARPNAGKNKKHMQLIPGGGAATPTPSAAPVAAKLELERTPQGIAIEERAYRLFVQETAAGRGLPRRAGGFVSRLHSLYRRRQRE
jgi:hypothetical protein